MRHSIRHLKFPAFVESREGNKWWARIQADGRDLIAEMRDPLPPGARAGSLFTIHRTKRGDTYLYWITRPVLSRNQVKRARQRGREMARFFRERIDAP